MEPIYVALPAHQKTFDRGLILLTAAILLVAAMLSALYPDAGILIWLNALVLLTIPALIWLLLPRRYEVYPDRLRLVLTLLANWDIPFESIAEARPARWWESYAAFGVRYATDPRRAVFIQRVRPGLFRNLNAVISPEDRDAFLAALQQSMASYLGSGSPRA
ncbi:MAG: hypothetical protein GEU75_00155 [Dehalococcoidia bacterium]|nr:hypothetical protein [Dehalococcoidia bacterium]